MRNLAIIPARSGSRGLPHKNIKPLNGKPLMAYTIEAAIESSMYSEVMVSTDSKEYQEIAKKYGATTPFLRTEDLSGDEASSWDVVRDVLNQYKLHEAKEFDSVTLLQPTSPLRKAQHIRDAFSLFHEKNAQSVISVCKCEHHPFWTGSLDDSLSMDDFDRHHKNLNRQSLPIFYRLNGAIYILRINSLLNIDTLYSNSCYAFIMEQNDSIDIDSLLDFNFAEFLLTKKI